MNSAAYSTVCVETFKRVIATVGLFEKKIRTSVCEFATATGKFTELLELPAPRQAVATGLAWHDEHLWVSYSVAEKGKIRFELAKVKLR